MKCVFFGAIIYLELAAAYFLTHPLGFRFKNGVIIRYTNYFVTTLPSK